MEQIKAGQKTFMLVDGTSTETMTMKEAKEQAVIKTFLNFYLKAVGPEVVGVRLLSCSHSKTRLSVQSEFSGYSMMAYSKTMAASLPESVVPSQLLKVINGWSTSAPTS